MRLPILLNTGLLFVASAVCAAPHVSAEAPIDTWSDRAADVDVEQQAAGGALADTLGERAALG